MAATLEYDLEINQGATYSKTFAWKDSGGVAVNLTSYTARMQIRRSVSDTEVLLSLTTENGRLVLGGSAGTIQMLLPSSVTELIDWRRGKYDLELVAPDGVVVRFLEGSVLVSREVTRNE